MSDLLYYQANADYYNYYISKFGCVFLINPTPHPLQAHDRLLSGDGQPSTPDQFSDFEDVVLPSVDEFHLEDFDQDQDAQQQNLDDFGHSLFVG